MWESIKKLFGFGKNEEVVEAPVVAPVVVKSEPKVEKVTVKAETPKAPKAKPVKEEAKVTAKEIKAKAKKEEPKAEKVEVKKPSKSRKPKSKQ